MSGVLETELSRGPNVRLFLSWASVVLMAHLRPIDVRRCITCGEPATQVLYSAFNVLLNYYCAGVCGSDALTAYAADERAHGERVRASREHLKEHGS